jgi:hypothetical protein
MEIAPPKVEWQFMKIVLRTVADVVQELSMVMPVTYWGDSKDPQVLRVERAILSKSKTLKERGLRKRKRKVGACGIM